MPNSCGSANWQACLGPKKCAHVRVGCLFLPAKDFLSAPDGWLLPLWTDKKDAQMQVNCPQWQDTKCTDWVGDSEPPDSPCALPHIPCPGHPLLPAILIQRHIPPTTPSKCQRQPRDRSLCSWVTRGCRVSLPPLAAECKLRETFLLC